MRRRWTFVLLGMMVLGLFASPLTFTTPARGAQQEGSFSAAAVLLAQGGDMSQYKYSLQEPPGWPPVKCEFNAAGSQVKVSGGGNVILAYRKYATQKVTVQTSLLQRLANGQYETLQTSGTLQTILTTDDPVEAAAPNLSSTLPVGPDYVVAVRINWHMNTSDTIEGWVKVLYSSYQPSVVGSATQYPMFDDCGSVFPPFVQHGTTSGTVNSTFNFTIQRFPVAVSVPITWDGTWIGAVTTNSEANGTSSFKIPAAPIGPHAIRWKYGHWDVTQTFTVKPRIKIIPSDVDRDQTVNVSLRGFAKHEVVRIRWKKGASWVEIVKVTTSSTGSANIDVKIPKFVPDGATSVRGDGTIAHAQTNAVVVSGGPFTASLVKTPTATPTPTSTPAATVTSVPTQTPVPPTATPTVQLPTVTEEPTTSTDETPTVVPEASPVAETT